MVLSNTHPSGNSNLTVYNIQMPLLNSTEVFCTTLKPPCNYTASFLLCALYYTVCFLFLLLFRFQSFCSRYSYLDFYVCRLLCIPWFMLFILLFCYPYFLGSSRVEHPQICCICTMTKGYSIPFYSKFAKDQIMMLR